MARLIYPEPVTLGDTHKYNGVVFVIIMTVCNRHVYILLLSGITAKLYLQPFKDSILSGGLDAVVNVPVLQRASVALEMKPEED